MARPGSKTITISETHFNQVAALDGQLKTNIENLIDLIPVANIIKSQGLSIEQAINRLMNVPTVTVIQKDETTVLPRGKNRSEFEMWLDKLISHNEKASQDDKVYITQRLFLNLIGGNVNTISKLYRENEELINEHNRKMKTDESTNRKISHKVREQYGTVTDWLKTILA